MAICTCPAAAALPTIPAMECGESFGQIQKLAFCRIYGADGAKNSFQTSTAITALASWQAKMTAADSSKIVVTPYVEAPTQDGGDAITFGGGNDTLGGMEKIIGSNPTTMSFALREYPQDIISALKQLACEKNLGVFFFNGNGQIEAIKDASEEGTYYPIPIFNLFVGDKIHGGFDTPDSNAMSFSLPANYSDLLTIVTPSFNPLLDLVNE